MSKSRMTEVAMLFGLELGEVFSYSQCQVCN